MGGIWDKIVKKVDTVSNIHVPDTSSRTLIKSDTCKHAFLYYGCDGVGGAGQGGKVEMSGVIGKLISQSIHCSLHIHE